MTSRRSVTYLHLLPHEPFNTSLQRSRTPTDICLASPNVYVLTPDFLSTVK